MHGQRPDCGIEYRYEYRCECGCECRYECRYVMGVDANQIKMVLLLRLLPWFGP